MIDGAIIAAGWGVCLAIFLYVGGRIPLDRHLAPFLLLMLSTVPLVYKLLWTFAGRDSIGMQETRLRLVDFDGNPPSRTRRYHRLAGSIISLLAAGMGLIWVFVDEDALTWHDHISGTFPAIAEE